MRSSSSSPDIVTLTVGVVALMALALWCWAALDPALGSVFVHLLRQLVESGARLGS
jgi:hypothetical protein